MRLDKVLVAQIEVMLSECFANFGLDEGRIPFIMCLAGELSKATLAMATRLTVMHYDPTMDGVRLSQQAIRAGKFKPDMSDEQFAEFCHSQLIANYMSARKQRAGR